MSNIRIDLDATIYDGQTITFKSPCDCSEVTGLKIYYPDMTLGGVVSQEFKFADAHGHDVGHVDELFVENVLVKIILDTTTNKAFVQNADTNAYLERRFEKLETDYIIEQGTEGIWTYRKWASGIAECWCSYTSELSVSTPWGTGNSHYHDTVSAKNFPSNLFASKPNVLVQMEEDTGNVFPVKKVATQYSTGEMYCVSPNQLNSAFVYIYIEAKGRWE